MRAVLWQDLVLAARVAACLPDDMRQAHLLMFLEQAHAADKYRKATGSAHPRWGDGTLSARLARLPRVPQPPRCDPGHAAALTAVLQALASWRAQRHWNRRARCTTLGQEQERTHDHRPPPQYRRL